MNQAVPPVQPALVPEQALVPEREQVQALVPERVPVRELPVAGQQLVPVLAQRA